MLSLIGALIALAWLSRPDDEAAIDTDSLLDSWATARANWSPAADPGIEVSRHQRGVVLG